ncbi:hypothetical protein HZA96_06130 [Candidatus Woesearchaeota archaeon]|nr:hypothetical protein [Candidatus Woesearchaeota archaeon]
MAVKKKGTGDTFIGAEDSSGIFGTDPITDSAQEALDNYKAITVGTHVQSSADELSRLINNVVTQRDTYLQDMTEAQGTVVKYSSLVIDGKTATSLEGLVKLIETLTVDRDTNKRIVAEYQDVTVNAKKFTDAAGLQAGTIVLEKERSDYQRRLTNYEAVTVDGVKPADSSDLQRKIDTVVAEREAAKATPKTPDVTDEDKADLIAYRTMNVAGKLAATPAGLQTEVDTVVAAKRTAEDEIAIYRAIEVDGRISIDAALLDLRVSQLQFDRNNAQTELGEYKKVRVNPFPLPNPTTATELGDQIQDLFLAKMESDRKLTDYKAVFVDGEIQLDAAELAGKIAALEIKREILDSQVEAYQAVTVDGNAQTDAGDLSTKVAALEADRNHQKALFAASADPDAATKLVAYQAILVDGTAQTDAAGLDLLIKNLVATRDAARNERDTALKTVAAYDALHNYVEMYLVSRSKLFSNDKNPTALADKLSQLIQIAKDDYAEIARLAPFETEAISFRALAQPLYDFANNKNIPLSSSPATPGTTMTFSLALTPTGLGQLHGDVMNAYTAIVTDRDIQRTEVARLRNKKPYLAYAVTAFTTVGAVIGVLLAYSNSDKAKDAVLEAQAATQEKDALKKDYDQKLKAAEEELQTAKTDLDIKLVAAEKANTDLRTTMAAMIPSAELEKAVDTYLTAHPEKVKEFTQKYIAEHPGESDKVVPYKTVVKDLVEKVRDGKLTDQAVLTELYSLCDAICDAIGKPIASGKVPNRNVPKYSTKDTFCNGLPKEMEFTSANDFVSQAVAHGRAAVRSRYSAATQTERDVALKVMDRYATQFAKRQLNAYQELGKPVQSGRFYVTCPRGE